MGTRCRSIDPFCAGVNAISTPPGEYGPACYTRQPDGSLLLEIGYTNEDVAAAWLLGFGAKAEVLEPPALRARMASEAQALCAVYGAPKK